MQRRDNRLIFMQLATEQFREHRSREVVGGGAKSTGGDHATGALERLSHGVGDFTGIVGDGGASRNRHADFAQCACQEDRVGVNSRAEQEFITDGDDLDGFVHVLYRESQPA